MMLYCIVGVNLALTSPAQSTLVLLITIHSYIAAGSFAIFFFSYACR